MVTMSRIVDDAIARYEQRRPKAAAANNLDPTYSALAKYVESILHLVDMVLEDEDIPVDTRRNVVRCILYGSPNPVDAEMRMENLAALREHLGSKAPSVVMQMPEGWTMPEEWKKP